MAETARLNIYDEIDANRRRTFFFILGFILFIVFLGWVIGYALDEPYLFPAIAFVIAAVSAGVSYYYSDRMVLALSRAHPDVFNILLQILEDGRLTDSKGHQVDFKNTVIIMTSNIGQRLIMEKGAIGFMAREDREATYDKIKETVMTAMKKGFKPEFLNRIDEIIVFHPLTDKELSEIASLIITDVQKQVRNQEMELEITDAAKAIIVKEGYEPKYGARPLRRAIQRLIENPLSNQIIEQTFKPKDKIRADAKDDKIVFEKIGQIGAVAEAKPEKPAKKPSGGKSKKK
ncbi:AAA family ATPase [Candidatus Margulisiibacteriota bacterium]